MRPVLLTALLSLVLATGASAQEPTVQIGEPASVAAAPVRAGGAQVGMLVVERTGSSIVARASFDRRPPGRRIRLCVTVDGTDRCVTRKGKRSVKLETQGDFATPVSATARSGAALGQLDL